MQTEAIQLRRAAERVAGARDPPRSRAGRRGYDASMTRASPQRLLAATLLAACAANSCATEPERAAATEPSAGHTQPSTGPNLVVVYCDDLGWGDLASYGHPTIRTPRLDRMAAEGARFTQFYSGSPACTASRYALMTGRVPKRSGFSWVLGPKSPRGLHENETTVAEGLQRAGYATAVFGKWHLGRPDRHLPLAHGFDEYLGLPYSNDMQPPRWVSLPLIEGNDVVELDPDQTRLTELYTDRALGFIERHRDRPFFVYLPYAMPHVPLHPGEEFAGTSTRGTYGDVVEEIDHHVGRLLDRLTELGLAGDTLVLFTSDNGPWIIKDDEGGSSGLLRDGKGSTWEGGVRVPAILWQPGTIEPGRVIRSVASTLDLLPTAFAMAGEPLPNGRAVDGRDLHPVLAGEEPQRDPLFFYGPKKLQAVRSGPWKLHVHTSSQTGVEHFDGRVPLLFHLERDPSERWDVSEEHPEVVEALLAEIAAHEAEVARTGTDWDGARAR